MSSLVRADSGRSLWLWRQGRLQPVEDLPHPDAAILAADSWLVTAGRVRALELHRSRFAIACGTDGSAPTLDLKRPDGRGSLPHPTLPRPTLPRPEQEAFWKAAVAEIPPVGDWFPKVEWRLVPGSDDTDLVFVLRPAPVRTRSVVVASHLGNDPRTMPRVKGPDLLALGRVRAAAQRGGAEEAIILSPDGFLVEGAYSALVWWQGAELCMPPLHLARIDSVTVKSLLALTQALGVSTQEELVRPADLAGRELWALSALHGIRIVTSWVDGPLLAEQPGRLSTWRDRLDRLAHPIVTLAR